MPVSNPKKTFSHTALDCNGRGRVTLSFDAAAELIDNPADIILIMDRSGSMAPPKIEFARAAAKQLFSMVATATGGAQTISGDTRIGVASFADTATQDAQLTNDLTVLDAAIDALSPGGFTNHNAGFDAGKTMFDPASSNRKIMIMFTDGATNVGGDPAPNAEAIKASGVELFCIGLVPDPAVLNLWASDPDSTHVAYTNDPVQLDEVFRQVGTEIILAGAIDAVIAEELNPDFKIIGLGTPTEGSVQMISPQKLEWTMDSVGTTPQSTATLTFDIMHIGTTGGVKKINKSIVYSDRDGGSLVFPDPEVTITCDGTIIVAEPCPVPTVFQAGVCQDAVIIDTLSTSLTSLGRIVRVNATVKNVCPGKRLAVGVILSEVGPNGEEHERGLKTLLIPAQGGTECRNLLLNCIDFVVPEALDAVGNPDSICNARTFKARVLANYVDTDYICCDADTFIS